MNYPKIKKDDKSNACADAHDVDACEKAVMDADEDSVNGYTF